VKLFIAKNKQNKTKQKHWNSPHSNLQWIFPCLFSAFFQFDIWATVLLPFFEK
jgi:hypothetical protein